MPWYAQGELRIDDRDLSVLLIKAQVFQDFDLIVDMGAGKAAISLALYNLQSPLFGPVEHLSVTKCAFWIPPNSLQMRNRPKLPVLDNSPRHTE